MTIGSVNKDETFIEKKMVKPVMKNKENDKYPEERKSCKLLGKGETVSGVAQMERKMKI